MPLTASQIVTLAGQMLNAPGRVSQIGQVLNLVLANYAQTIDEDVIRKTTTLNIGPQAVIPYFYPLPSDYLRFYDVFYLVNGEPFYLYQMELSNLDKQYTGSGVSNYPESFTTDISINPQPTAVTSPAIAFYPPPSIPIAVTVRYRPQTGDIATPETSSVVPWFPNQLTLLKELLVHCSDLVDDVRKAGWKDEVDGLMRKYLSISDDKEGFAQTVKLDPGAFRPRFNFPPSKKTGF